MPRYPRDDYEPMSTYKGFELRGRFLPDLQSHPARSFHVLAVRDDGVHFLERAIVAEGHVLDKTLDEVEAALERFTVREARRRITSGEFSDDGNYAHELQGL